MLQFIRCRMLARARARVAATAPLLRAALTLSLPQQRCNASVHDTNEGVSVRVAARRWQYVRVRKRMCSNRGRREVVW